MWNIAKKSQLCLVLERHKGNLIRTHQQWSVIREQEQFVSFRKNRVCLCSAPVLTVCCYSRTPISWEKDLLLLAHVALIHHVLFARRLERQATDSLVPILNMEMAVQWNKMTCTGSQNNFVAGLGPEPSSLAPKIVCQPSALHWPLILITIQGYLLASSNWLPWE